MKRLRGKVVLVTGAGRGIGKAIALACAKEGAFVVCAARTVREVDSVRNCITEEGGQARSIAADVTDAAQVQHMFEAGLHGMTRLDVLVANAGRGGGSDRTTIRESNPARWREMLEVNLLGAYHCMRAALPWLLAAEAAKIIVTGSGSRLRASPGLSAYSAAKAGLWALTRTLAEELKPHHIAVNELVPGPVLRESMARHGQRWNADTGPPMELANGEWLKTPGDVTDLALFLATQPRLGPTGQSFSLARK